MQGALAQTTPEQRSPLYEDVEKLISPGFLSHTLTIGGMKLALRSLTPGDLFLLQSRVGKGREIDWKIWTLASSIWLMDGYVLLGNVNAVPRIAAAFYHLPKSSQEILFSVMLGLFSRQSKAMDAIESYCYESGSRLQWKTYGGHLPKEHAGIQGVDSLGSNHIQRMWAFFNDIEDQRHQDETLWNGFKLSVSPHSPDGVKKLDAHDTQKRQNELSRRQAVHDRFFYTKTGVIKPGQKEDRKIYGVVVQPKTDEDLVDEMYRWVTGKEDAHDKAINDYKQKIQDRYEQEKQDQLQRQMELRARREQVEAAIPGKPRLVAYTPEELTEILKNRQPGKAGARNVTIAPPGRDYVYSKYVEKAPIPGNLRPQDGKLAVGTDKGSDLTQQIAQRQVRFNTEGE